MKLPTIASRALRMAASGGSTMRLQGTGADRVLHTSAPKLAAHQVDELFVNNQKWREEMTRIDPQYFSKHATGQKPKYLWIGCADSRVPAESLTGMPPGSLFVHRNIANVVNNVDTSAMSIIQFAVLVLQVEHIVVCGHYNCGGVAAAVKNLDLAAPLENWLRNIRDVYRLHKQELDAIQDVEERCNRLVEINVIEQAINLYKARAVQQRRVETYKQIKEAGFVKPRIHPCVYNPGTGELKRLDVELQDHIKNIRGIYNILSVDGDKGLYEGMGPSTHLP